MTMETVIEFLKQHSELGIWFVLLTTIIGAVFANTKYSKYVNPKNAISRTITSILSISRSKDGISSLLSIFKSTDEGQMVIKLFKRHLESLVVQSQEKIAEWNERIERQLVKNVDYVKELINKEHEEIKKNEELIKELDDEENK